MVASPAVAMIGAGLPTKTDNDALNTADKSAEPVATDACLENKVERAFLRNRILKNCTISSRVRMGEAVLRGSLQTEVVKQLAEQVALRIEGINSVDNQLQVETYTGGDLNGTGQSSLAQEAATEVNEQGSEG